MFVKQSLAASLGEVASLIGTDATEEYLVPFAENLLESDTAEIVTSVMRAVHSFFPVLTEPNRRRLSGVSFLMCCESVGDSSFGITTSSKYLQLACSDCDHGAVACVGSGEFTFTLPRDYPTNHASWSD